MSNYKKDIAKILSDQIDMPMTEIEQLIEISKVDSRGDFTLPCFKLVNKFNYPPNIIAEKLKYKCRDKYFEKIDNIGPYLNFFIDRRYISEKILKEILDKDIYYGFSEKGKGKIINVEYYHGNVESISNMEEKLICISIELLTKLLKENGYEVKCISHDKINLRNEIYYSYKSDILNNLKEKKLLIKQNGCEVVSLEKFNLPPYILLKEGKENRFNIDTLSEIINISNDNNFYKSIYFLYKSQKTHFNQVISVLKMAEYKWVEGFFSFDLGIVKVVKNDNLNKEEKIVSLEDLIKKVTDIIDKKIGINEVKYDKKMLNKVAIYSIVFHYIINLNKKFINFDLEYITSFKEKNFLYVVNSINKASLICCNLNDSKISNQDIIDISNEEFKLIKMLDSFQSKVYKAIDKLQLDIIPEYIIELTNILNELYLNVSLEKSQIKNKDLILIKATCQIIKNALGLLRIKLI